MPTLWIRNTPLSFKKLVLIYFLSILAIFIFIFTNTTSLLFLFLGIFISFSFYVAIITHNNGIYVLRKNIEDQQTYQVRDFLSLNNSSENYREIVDARNNAIVLSRIFLNQKKPWAFFDLFRLILLKQKNIKRVLLLGGGGGAVAKTISEQFPNSEVTVIEISKEMIEIAKNFFLQKNKRIKLIQRDAFKFIKKNKELFDVIIIDLFNGQTICSGIKKNDFIKNIFKSGKTILINFGFDYENITQYTNPYKEHARRKNQPLHLYLHGKNIIGCNTDTSKLKLSTPRIDNL